MAHIIEMPKLSDTMEEGGIANWLKQEGDFVEDGDPLLEIETDKATMEYQSPEEGYLLKILVPAGQTTALSTPIAILGEKGEALPDIEKVNSDNTAPSASQNSAKNEEVFATPTPSLAPQSQRHFSSPVARKIAKEKGIDITSIQGSGPAGRVILRDVANSAESQSTVKPSSDLPPASTNQQMELNPTATQAYHDKQNSMMRKTIAKRLLQGKNEAPHFYLKVSANMAKANDWRKQLNSDLTPENSEQKVSMNDIIILAVSRALLKHPQVNASWQGDFIRVFHEAHVSVAVALESGLITPVIRNAHQMSLKDIAITSKNLVRKAKSGDLQPEEYANGTFTISNLGMMGIESFTAIINPPQAAILAVGATQMLPCVRDDNSIAVEPRMNMTLSCDHRVIDGALGASFLATLKRYLEDPVQILVG